MQADAYYPVYEDVAYNAGGNTHKRLADVYYPDEPAPAGGYPTLLYFNCAGFMSSVRDGEASFSAGHDLLRYYALEAGWVLIDVEVTVTDVGGAALGGGMWRDVTDPEYDLDGFGDETWHSDAKNCVQFFRYNASAYGLDPDRFAAGGRSAGSLCAMAAALDYDAMDPTNTNPMRTVSSRVAALVDIKVGGWFSGTVQDSAVGGPETQNVFLRRASDLAALATDAEDALPAHVLHSSAQWQMVQPGASEPNRRLPVYIWTGSPPGHGAIGTVDYDLGPDLLPEQTGTPFSGLVDRHDAFGGLMRYKALVALDPWHVTHSKLVASGTYTAGGITPSEVIFDAHLAAQDQMAWLALEVPENDCTAGSLACDVETDEYIGHVVLGTIDNSSSPAAGCYGDFSGLSTDLVRLVGGAITVTNGNPFAGDQCTVWADWNQDGDFTDLGEETALDGGPETFSGAIVPPGGAPLGAARLRVRLENVGIPLPCGMTSVGEVEDYTVNVTVAPAPPANDSCAGALAIGTGTFSGTTVAATNDGTATCDPGGATSRDVWYALTAPATGTLSVNTCGSAIDTSLSVFSSCAGAELACSDQCGGAPCASPSACLSLEVASGQSVRIRVSDKGIAGGGAFSLSTSLSIAGDVCGDALPIAVPSSTIGDLTHANVEAGLPACGGPGPLSISGGSFGVSGKGLWYKVNVPTSRTVTAHTLIDPGFNSRISVYTGVCGSLSGVTANDDIATPSLRSKVAWQATAGQDYFVLVSGFSSATSGPFVLTVTSDPIPVNDLCSGATPIGPINGTVFGTTVGATGDASNLKASSLASCANDSAVPVFDVWFSYTAPCTGTLAVDTCGAYDTLLSASALCPTPGTSHQLVPSSSSCSDSGAGGCAPGSRISIAVTQGTTYLLRVAGGIGAAPGGTFALTWALPDVDGDGLPDGCDGCPNDPFKIAPGACGCGAPDTDTDGDGAADCIDGCPGDPNKTAPGGCGCGVPDVDTDGDGTPNCVDGCPNDPLKSAPGACGCGAPETDSDGDGTPNCVDGCPNDPLKSAPGACGCGVPDTDSDGDGTPNCLDGCPNDPNKLAPGVCGCGAPDTDSDGDGTPNCVDSCPNDPSKVAPGVCGCGAPELDTDSDGTFDCLDLCPNDPLKIAPGACGCGVPESACQTLSADISSLSIAAGGTQHFVLNAGLIHSGDLYLVLGSLSGTAPGTLVGPGKTLALNNDAYLMFTLLHPNTPPLVNTLGTIPPLGIGTAALALPPGMPVSLVGLTVHHAYLIIETSPYAAAGDLSNPVSLALLP